MYGMRDRDSHDALTSLLAIVFDMAAVWGAEILAVWIRFSSGWIPLSEPVSEAIKHAGMLPAGLYRDYMAAALFTLPLYLAVFQLLKLYTRPQDGTFTSKIPRIVRGCILGVAGVLICTGLLKNTYAFISNGAVLISFATVTLLVIMERLLLFKLEILLARRAKPCHRALVLGANNDAALFIKAVRSEPRMRTEVVAVKAVCGEKTSPDIPSSLVLPEEAKTEDIAEKGKIDMLVLASHRFSHDEKVRLILFCERHLIRFAMIPDLFRIMTNRMELQMVGNIPLVGIGRYPLDQVWNRMAKRIVDIIGSAIGLVLSLPVIMASAVFIKLESPGPVFYGQERCGRGGKTFRIYKLRTMRRDAENSGRPGWTQPNDPRRTKCGAFLRKWNIDELPQFWNVLKGEMSLVGPRPERPYYVERFTSDVEHYMWRHVSKPGLTGWAQVNGFRGDTSISERVRYDLHYLENWSLAFDFKILAMTFFAYRNAG